MMRQSIFTNGDKRFKRTNDGTITPSNRRSKPEQVWNYPFQKFSASFICKVLNGQGLEFTSLDMMNPHPLKVLEVYEAFSETISDKVIDDFREFTDSEMEILGEDDSYLDSLILQKFSKHLTRMFQVLHFNDFNLEDLIYPSTARFHATLCALISFWQYFESRAPEVEGIKEKEREIISKKMEVEASNQAFFEEFERLRLSNQNLAPKFEELKKTSMEITKEAYVRGANHNSMVDKSKELSEIHKSKKAELQKIHEDISALEASCEQLENMIVSDPKALVAHLESLREKHKVKSAELQVSKNQVQNIKSQKEDRVTVTQEINSRKETMLQCLEEKNINEELQAEMTKLVKEAEELKSRILDLEVNIKGKEQIAENTKKKEAMFKESSNIKLKTLEEKVDGLDKQITVKESDRVNKQANLNQLKQKLDTLDLQAANIISTTDLEIDSLRRECNFLNDKIDIYITTLNHSVLGN